MIIDIHTHLAYTKIFPDKFLSEVVEPLESQATLNHTLLKQLVSNSLQDKDGSLLLKKMDAAGIDKAVLLIADFGYALGEAEFSLEEMFLLHKQVRDRYPDRFMIFGGVDPRRGREGVDLFERSVRNYGFSGLKLYPPCGFELDDPGLYPLYEICNALKIPVLSHTGPSLKSMRTEQEYPATILKVANEFPRLQFILAHGGARDCETTVSVARQRKNVYFDISTFQAFCRERAALDARFRYFFDYCPDQVLFGTDWPMFLMSATQGQLVKLVEDCSTITSAEKDKMFSGNALHVLPSSQQPHLNPVQLS